MTLIGVLVGFAYAFWQHAQGPSLSIFKLKPVSSFRSVVKIPSQNSVSDVVEIGVENFATPVAPIGSDRRYPIAIQNAQHAAAPSWSRHYLPKPDVKEVHAANVVATEQHLFAFWYGGSREGSRDARIFAADWPLNSATQQWQNVREVITPQRVANDQQRWIKKIGNAVPYVDAHGVIWLMFVSVSVGGWAGSSLNLTFSNDQGQTWSTVKRLVTSPFFNISTLGRSPPLVYENGDTLWPVYHEFIAKFAQGLHLDAQGNVLGLRRISWGRQGYQPSIVAWDSRQAVALLRSVGHKNLQDHAVHDDVDERLGQVTISRTEDAGEHWSKPKALPQINPDAGLVALQLFSGDMLWVYNDAPHSRHVLSLGISRDHGETWRKLCDIANDPQMSAGPGFSYPSLAQDDTGRIHLLYSEGRQEIRHESFTQAWLYHWPEGSLVTPLCSEGING